MLCGWQSASFGFIDNKYNIGTPIKHKTLQQCIDVCKSKSGCKAFSFKKGKSKSDCYLKSSLKGSGNRLTGVWYTYIVSSCARQKAGLKKAGLMGFREKKNANLLKTFCSLNADKILESSRHFGVLGDLLRAMAVKSKKSGVQQYAAVMRHLRRRNSRGIPRYVLSHIRNKMKWRANGILYPFTKGKTAMTGIQAKMLGFKQNKLGLQKFDTPSKTLIKLLVSKSTKKKKRAAGLKFDAKTFRALKKWTGN